MFFGKFIFALFVGVLVAAHCYAVVFSFDPVHNFAQDSITFAWWMMSMIVPIYITLYMMALPRPFWYRLRQFVGGLVLGSIFCLTYLELSPAEFPQGMTWPILQYIFAGFIFVINQWGWVVPLGCFVLGLAINRRQLKEQALFEAAMEFAPTNKHGLPILK